MRSLENMMGFPRILAIGSTLFALNLGGCALLPGAGPESWDVRKGQQDSESLQYALIRLTPDILEILSRNEPRLTSVFSDHSPPTQIRFGIGDIVGVTIFEAASGGLFIPEEAGVRPGNFITLPSQQVDSKGNISIPYAQPIHAAGRTQVEVQKSIVDALEARAIEPQVVVSLIEQRATLISVLGDVNAPNRFPVNHAGERVLDAIAQAGGPKFQGYEEWVVLERNGHRAVEPFGELIWESSTNIYLQPEDTIYLFHQPQTILAFGSTGNQGIFNFESWRMSLAEALGKASGLNDGAADASSVFLYRGETVEVARLLGVDVSKYQGPIIPVVYVLDLRNPAGWLLARKFDMRNKDVIYVPNSVTVEASKAMNFFRLAVGTVNDPIQAAVGVYALKAAAVKSASVLLVGGTTATAAP
jgi:polysaccharide export outer membrane protein